MRQKFVKSETPFERIVKSARRAIRNHHSPDEKTRIVLDGLRGRLTTRNCGLIFYGDFIWRHDPWSTHFRALTDDLS